MIIKYFLKTLICLFLLSFSVFSQKLVFDSSFTPTLNGSVNFIEIQSDGKILIAGEFTTVNGVTRKNLARLNPDGSLDTSFDANWLGSTVFISSMKLLPDGKILVAGSFGSGANPTVRRLNADSTPDSTLTSVPFLATSGFFQRIDKVDQMANGKIFLCGNFDLPNGNAKPGLARYNNDGTYDATFTTSIDNNCADLEVQPDGKYLVSGSYTTVNGSSRTGLTRFNTDDSVDTSFNPAPSPKGSPAYYSLIELQSDGKILGFMNFGFGWVLRRMNADGSLQTNFSNRLSEAFDVAEQSNGKVIAVGEYVDDNGFGQSADFNRYNTDGTHDPSSERLSFYGPQFPHIPKAVAIASDGNVITGGNFATFTFNLGPHISRPYLVRFVAQPIPVKPKYDFDGDGKDDIAVFRPSESVWYLNGSTAGFSATQFGLSTDTPIAADYDGDGHTDIAVFRDGVYYWLRSSDGVFAYKVCGQAGDIPQPPDDYFDVNSTGFLVYRPSASLFYTQRPFQQNAQSVEFRNMTLLPTDKPVVADFDGDLKRDLAVFRDGDWFFMESSHLETKHYHFGLAGDKPAIGDFDGDLRTDFAVYRPSEGIWYVQKSVEGFYAVRWGLAEDLPVPADYDGDGRTDIAVFRPSTGDWYILKSTGSYHIEHFGLTNDIPVQLR